MGEKASKQAVEKWKGTNWCTMKGDGTGDSMVEKNSYCEQPVESLETMVKSWPVQSLRAMSGSVVMQ